MEDPLKSYNLIFLLQQRQANGDIGAPGLGAVRAVAEVKGQDSESVLEGELAREERLKCKNAPYENAQKVRRRE